MNYRNIFAALALVVGMWGCTQPTGTGTGNGGATDQTSEQAQPTETTEPTVNERIDETKQTLSDSALATRMKTGLMAADQLDTSDINIEVSGKTITMNGTARSLEESTRAQKIVEGLAAPGYMVDNNLTVRSAEQTRER